eukprot:358064-Chlamydomonas_euryale.AAC.2
MQSLERGHKKVFDPTGVLNHLWVVFDVGSRNKAACAAAVANVQPLVHVGKHLHIGSDKVWETGVGDRCGRGGCHPVWRLCHRACSATVISVAIF